MSAAYKITARGYCITARANITATLCWQANPEGPDDMTRKSLEECGYGG